MTWPGWYRRSARSDEKKTDGGLPEGVFTLAKQGVRRAWGSLAVPVRLAYTVTPRGVLTTGLPGQYGHTMCPREVVRKD